MGRNAARSDVALPDGLLLSDLGLVLGETVTVRVRRTVARSRVGLESKPQFLFVDFTGRQRTAGRERHRDVRSGAAQPAPGGHRHRGRANAHRVTGRALPGPSLRSAMLERVDEVAWTARTKVRRSGADDDAWSDPPRRVHDEVVPREVTPSAVADGRRR